jgi:hypothetical protein
MGGTGVRLLTIRRQWQLSLREVEKRSLCLAQEKGTQSYQVSASWLHPMIPAGSIIQIDIQKHAISTRRNSTHEFRRS